MRTDTVKKGTEFEKKVLSVITALLKTDSFMYSSKNTKIFHQKSYYSRERESNIKLDITIEVFLPEAKEYSQLCVIECKDYTNPVSIDNIEEFKSKLDQIAGKNVKGIFCSSANFQKSVFNYARVNGIGLCRLLPDDQIKWEIYREFYSPITWERVSQLKDDVERGLTTKEYIANTNFIFSYFENEYYYNLANFIAFFLDYEICPHITNTELYTSINNNNCALKIPYITNDRIEQIVNDFYINATNRQLEPLTNSSISEIKLYIKNKYNFTFIESQINAISDTGRKVLGKIHFYPRKVEICNHQNIAESSKRFTLAHEIGHIVLHGGYFLSESSDDHEDYEDSETPIITRNSEFYKRMEIQANLFASSLLMPKIIIDENLVRLIEHNNLFCKKSILYLDHQECNKRIYYKITDDLMKLFTVSRHAIKNRLVNLGYLTVDLKNSWEI